MGHPSKIVMPDDIFEVDPETSQHTPKAPLNAGFRVRKVPFGYGDQVQLSAVLRPLSGVVRTPREVLDATLRLRIRWRRQATRLSEAGWGSLGLPEPKRTLGNAISCPVAFVMTFEKKKRPCMLRTVCPFCWAREARELWLRVDDAFFPPLPAPRKGRVRPVDAGAGPAKAAPEKPARSPYDMIVRRQAFYIPARSRITAHGVTGQAATLPAFLESRSTGRPYKGLDRKPEVDRLLKEVDRKGPWGVLETIRHEPAESPTPDWAWTVTIRQVLLVPHGVLVPMPFHPISAEGDRLHERHALPRRADVCGQVARLYRYPAALLGPDIPAVVAMLEARKGRRLTAAMGKFLTRH